ncbi:hypothetical protein [Streptomyces sp. NPDC050287]|uniref:hypothetical protein n=1 Tax=Streptomyces sp. NPDC050287 TaxID=3365608 RepID=UPI00378BD2AC
MLDWVVALAQAGGTTLVTAMAGDAWQGVRDAFGGLLGRGDADGENRALARLDAAAATVAQASAQDDDAVLGQVAGQWQTRLQDFLEEYPEAREQLEGLIEQARSQVPEERAVQVTQAISHSTVKGNAIQVGTVRGDFTVGSGPS